MDYSPTVRARRLIREIVRLRTDSGLSIKVAASRLDWSKSKLYRIEAGRTRISTDDLEDMLDPYGVRSPQREALIQLGRDAVNVAGGPPTATCSPAPTSAWKQQRGASG
jgi:transcriptional regulator with XRE-family HTH domain